MSEIENNGVANEPNPIKPEESIDKESANTISELKGAVPITVEQVENGSKEQSKDAVDTNTIKENGATPMDCDQQLEEKEPEVPTTETSLQEVENMEVDTAENGTKNPTVHSSVHIEKEGTNNQEELKNSEETRNEKFNIDEAMEVPIRQKQEDTPVQETENEPVQKMENTPVQEMENTPVPEIENLPAQQTENRPARETENVTVQGTDNLPDQSTVSTNSCPTEENTNAIANVASLDSINNCYCNKKRNFDFVELQCAGCYKWFHETCITIPLGKCLPFMTYYTFFCKLCNPSGSETFSKKQPNFTQMCATALANLTHQAASEDKPKTMFSKDKEVIPFLEARWEFLTSMPRRVKQTWHSTVLKAMLKDNESFICEEKAPLPANASYYPIFGLVNQDLSKIGPSYETMARSGLQKQIQDTTQTSGFTAGKGRSAKRRFLGDGQITAGGKKVKSDLVMPKLPPNGYPLEHPFNKDGYRYILAEPDQHAPFRQEFDESQDWAGKPIPGWLYRKLTPNNVLLALHDRAPQLKVSEDRLSVTGEKGYCMIRATHGVSWGTWYYEIAIDDMVDGSASRLGWSQGLANLQAPLGYDKFSYSWRSRKGTKFHESRGYHFSDEGYGQGDTLGFLIHLPRTTKLRPLPPIYKDKPLVKFKSYLYYEEKDESQLELKRLKPLKGSKIACYKNGKLIGTAFEDIYKGMYYPAASLYKSCSITFNFGPVFKHPPTQPFKSMHEAAHDAVIEQTMTDLLFFTENKGKLRLDNIF